MNHEAYIQMAAVESDHWWYSGRRSILEKVIKQLDLPPNANILEAGCGTGGNLGLLAGFGKVHAFEMNTLAVSLARTSHPQADIRCGRFPDDVSFSDKQFDLICLFDVLEHLENDTEALKHLHKRLAPGGRLVITVPALQMLWSQHDVMLHHHRRYTKTALLNVVTAAGLTPQWQSYFNTLLFPLAVLTRWISRFTNTPPAGDKIPAKAINKLLLTIFSAEKNLLYPRRLPFGVSLIAIAA